MSEILHELPPRRPSASDRLELADQGWERPDALWIWAVCWFRAWRRYRAR